MQITFGTEKYKGQLIEVAKIVTDTPSELSGQFQFKQEFPDCNQTDSFYIVRKIREATNGESYYAWYEIINHYRYIDYFTPQKESLMPYTETKTAYIDDTEVIFTDVPTGNLSVYLSDTNGGFPSFTVERVLDTIMVHFEPLEYVTKVTISIAKEIKA
jgi:hypothetical protein